MHSSSLSRRTPQLPPLHTLTVPPLHLSPSFVTGSSVWKANNKSLITDLQVRYFLFNQTLVFSLLFFFHSQYFFPILVYMSHNQKKRHSIFYLGVFLSWSKRRIGWFWDFFLAVVSLIFYRTPCSPASWICPLLGGWFSFSN